MIQQGAIIKSDTGRKIRVDGFIKAGGQGVAYKATEVNSGKKGVFKEFYERFANPDTVERLRFLRDQDLHSACRSLCTPFDVVQHGDLVGHYAPFVPGQSAEDFLANPQNTFFDGLLLALTLAHAVHVMHERNIAHGDLSADNLMIHRKRSVFQLHIIDHDNFNAPRIPPPAMVGRDLYMAPELRMVIKNKKPAIPNINTDRFALAVLIHEIILLRHVAAGYDDTKENFHKAMCSGIWRQDPARADRPNGHLGGYPPEVLSSDLMRLFRAAMSLNPAIRPSAELWETELWKAFHSVYACPVCNGPFVIDISKVSCPVCKRAFPPLTLRNKKNGRVISLASGATIVGRAEIGGSAKVSARHAVFRRVGPETWMESMGSNGTYRRNGTTWRKFLNKKPYLVEKGDWLRLADVEVQLSEGRKRK